MPRASGNEGEARVLPSPAGPQVHSAQGLGPAAVLQCSARPLPCKPSRTPLGVRGPCTANAAPGRTTDGARRGRVGAEGARQCQEETGTRSRTRGPPRGFSGVSRAATQDTCPSANGGCIGVTVVTSQPGRQRVRRTNGTSQGVGLRAANPSSGHQGAEGRASSGVSPRHCGKRGTGGNPGWRGAGVWAGHSESWGMSWAGSRPGRLHPPRTPPTPPG